MAKRLIQLVATPDPIDKESVEIPVYETNGIFTRNHPDFGKPNLLQASFCLERLEGEKKQIGGILKAISALLPQNEVIESLVWAAYKLHQDQSALTNLRHALCLDGKEASK